jgi:hypothetical protein
MEDWEIDFHFEGEEIKAKVTEVRGFVNLLYQIEILDDALTKKFGRVQSIYMIDEELMVNSLLHSEHWQLMESIKSSLQRALGKN